MGWILLFAKDGLRGGAEAWQLTARHSDGYMRRLPIY
jgi:hypothetical protein